MKRRPSPSYKWFWSRESFTHKEAAAMKQLYLGIDWGKKFSHFFGFDQDGVVVVQGRLNTLGMDEWVKMLATLKDYAVHAAFEIGSHYDWLYDLLNEHCKEVSV